MSSWDFTDPAPTVTRCDPETRRKAALYLCGVAGNATDARPVLEALGLVEPLEPSPQGPR